MQRAHLAVGDLECGVLGVGLHAFDGLDLWRWPSAQARPKQRGRRRTAFAMLVKLTNAHCFSRSVLTSSISP